MTKADGTHAHVEHAGRGFKLLSILGCVGTLSFLLLEAYREHLGGEWRAWQAQYAESLDAELRAGFDVGVKQAFVPDLGRVDRCQSCHTGIDDPSMVQAELPLRAHSGDVLANHPVEDFGCTICHQGQGRAVERDQAHGAVAHWEEPLLRGELVYTTCGKCHTEHTLYGHQFELYAGEQDRVEIYRDDLRAGIPGAEILARGKKLVATSGCLGCHAYRGVGGGLGPDLTFIGDKGVHGYDFSHLPKGVERSPLDWLVAHFMDPGALSPGTVMPSVGTSEADALALATYMLSLRSREVPARYRVAPRTVGEALAGSDSARRIAEGEELYQLFCVACHGRELKGGEVPEIRTPSLANEGFLSVASDAFLTSTILHGRSGTQMPAWDLDSGGLEPAQIARIVAYIRSFQPERADLAEVSREKGNPKYGRALYRGNCAACHGLDGEGGIGTRLNSLDFLALASDEFLARSILEGRPDTGMPSWKGLRSEEVSDLLAFLRSWEKEGATVEEALAHMAASSGNTRIGKRIYRARCADCHGKEGQGSIGPSVVHENFLSLVSDEYLAAAILEGRPGTAMPSWKDLTAEDTADLIAFLRKESGVSYEGPAPGVAQGDPETGALLFQRTCASCHGDEAVGGTGPQLRNPVFLAHASDGFLYETIARGRDGTPMRAFLRGGIADLTPAQIADIVGWLRSLEHASPSALAPRPALGSVARGQEIYERSAACAGCHGVRGEGGLGSALGNPAFLSQASDGFLVATLVLGRDGTTMRNYGTGGNVQLSPEELMDVSAYVRSLGLTGAFEPGNRAGWRAVSITADQIELGAEHFQQYCASCHGSEGRGGFAPELNNPEFLAAASNGFLVATIARGRETTPMRAFGPGHSGLASLTHEDIQAIVGFIRTWDLENPSSPVTRGAATSPFNEQQ